MAKRKEATAALLSLIEELLPGSQNTALYKERLTAMNDDEFGQLMEDLESGKEILPLIVPNGSKPRLSIERNFALAEKLGHNFFEHLWLTDPATGTTYKTPHRYLIVDLPLRRQAQTLQKKISIPENNQTVDQLTDQPTGPSKGARISFPELQILYAQGLGDSLTELIKYRGGDTKGYNLMNRSIIKEGGVSLKTLSNYNTTVKSTRTLHNYLLGMHLSNNL